MQRFLPISQCDGAYRDIDWVYTGGWNLHTVGPAWASESVKVSVKVKSEARDKFVITAEKQRLRDQLMAGR